MVWYFFTAVGFHPVAVVSKLVKLEERDSDVQKAKQYKNNKTNAEYTR